MRYIQTTWDVSNWVRRYENAQQQWLLLTLGWMFKAKSCLVIVTSSWKNLKSRFTLLPFRWYLSFIILLFRFWAAWMLLLVIMKIVDYKFLSREQFVTWDIYLLTKKKNEKNEMSNVDNTTRHTFYSPIQSPFVSIHTIHDRWILLAHEEKVFNKKQSRRQSQTQQSYDYHR